MSSVDHLGASAAASPIVASYTVPLIFAGTIFTSAFLLFGVQPMFTKMVLPTLGGSPAVWSVAMVFFQALLLLGYLYAHLSSRWLSATQALVVHGLLVLTAVLTLPLSVSQSFGNPPEAGQILWLIRVFTVSVGLPFLVLAATAPLLQAWFARSGHARSGNPYALYVASNLGSFTALIAYPMLIEPLLALKMQTTIWAMVFGALGFGLALCGGVTIWLRSVRSPATAEAIIDSSVSQPLSWKQRGVWTLLAAVPSGLLVSVTAHLSTDVASAPLLWLMPLAIFMLTFILAFRDMTTLSDEVLETWFARVAPFIILSLVGLVLPLWLQFAAHLGGLFLAAMICHRSLYRSRPNPALLTEFYLWMSFGGMLGGLFAGLMAPLLFDTILEYRILLIAALLCLPAARNALTPRQQLAFLVFGALVGVLAMLGAPVIEAWNRQIAHALCVVTGAAFLGVIILNRWGPIANASAAFAVFLIMAPVGTARHDLATRSFFGVNYVRTDETGQIRLLAHGSTVHGAYRFAGPDGKPMAGLPQPTVYYHDEGAINVALREARAQLGGRPATVGVVGLGAGALACQSAPGENWVFFEIDHEVVKLAKRDDLFPFVSRCTPQARIVIGDGRLMLQQESGKFDVIILDAFSSDAVPAHLLTREAFAIYAERLNPGGTIIAHVSNRYMDIRSVVEAAALSHGFLAASISDQPDMQQPKSILQMAAPSTVVALSREEAVSVRLIGSKGWERPDDAVRRLVWTDDYANIMGAIIRRFW
jgi:hypothetical protein